MTALGRREVKRTFSAVARELTGLSGAETHEAERQQLGDFGQPFMVRTLLDGRTEGLTMHERMTSASFRLSVGCRDAFDRNVDQLVSVEERRISRKTEGNEAQRC